MPFNLNITILFYSEMNNITKENEIFKYETNQIGKNIIFEHTNLDCQCEMIDSCSIIYRGKQREILYTYKSRKKSE